MDKFYAKDMKPENIPEDIIKQAEIAHAQLFIHTHTLNIIQKTLHVYMICLDIWTMQVGKHKLLIQIDMEELFSECTMTTYGFIELINVLKQLEQCINNDIELLYEEVAQKGRRHTICMTTDSQKDEAPMEKAPQQND